MQDSSPRRDPIHLRRVRVIRNSRTPGTSPSVTHPTRRHHDLSLDTACHTHTRSSRTSVSYGGITQGNLCISQPSPQSMFSVLNSYHTRSVSSGDLHSIIPIIYLGYPRSTRIIQGADNQGTTIVNPIASPNYSTTPHRVSRLTRIRRCA